MDIEHKDVLAEVKELSEKGEGVLRFIKFHQEDKDFDITFPGFIQQQRAVLLASHNWKSDLPPLGSGESFESDGATHFRFRLNMHDDRAKAWHSWLAMDRKDGLQQVSYGFSPYPDATEKWQKEGRSGRYLKPRQDGSPGAKLHEVSFVVVGSGNDTGVLDIKAFDDLPEPETTDGELDDLKAAGVQVQSLIFPRDHWESADAVRSWLSSHGYSTSLDSTGSSWRARQKSPDDFTRLRSFCINPSRSASNEACRVMAVGGVPKESRGMDAEHPVIEVSQGRWAVGVHVTETSSQVWDAGIQLPRIHKSGEPGYFRSLYAAQNPHSDLTQKTGFALPHHFVDADGHAGPASVRACVEGLEVVHRFWGGLLAKEHIEAVKAHLEAHIRDAGREPIQVRSASDGGQYPLDPLIELWCWDGEQLLHRLDSIREIKARQGHTLSEARLKQVVQMSDIFQTLRTLLSIKHLDQPTDAVLEQLSAEARADALGQRLEQMRSKVQHESDDREAQEIALRVQRWQQHLRIT